MIREIAALTMKADTRPQECGLPRVLMIKGKVPAHQLAALYQPMIGFVVQGSKTIAIGDRRVHVKAPGYFLLPLHLPATAAVRGERDGRPYLSLGLGLDQGLLQALMKDIPPAGASGPAPRVEACPADPAFVEAWLRMLRLLKTPRDIPALAPVYEREILYRVLAGPQGAHLRQLGLKDRTLSRITRAVQSLRTRRREPVEIRAMASQAAMAVNTFHRQFKRATGLSPIQFQKRLRLLDARDLLAFEDYSAAGAAYEVGYQSPSQFNREYSRFFGAPPARDAAALRRAG